MRSHSRSRPAACPRVRDPRGFGVVKVLEKKPPATRTYDEVKEALKLDMGRLVEQDALKAKANELAKGAAIEVLDASYIVPPQGAPPGAGREEALGPPAQGFGFAGRSCVPVWKKW